MNVSGEIFDQRKKLTTMDVQRINFQYSTGYTIRMISNEHGISTKYVKKLLTGTQVDDDYSWRQDICSGCGRTFDYSGLMTHYEMFTSGSIKPLDCWIWMAGVDAGGAFYRQEMPR